MAAVVAALLMSVTLFARSFKEAQTYVAPMSFLLIVPAIALQFKDLIGTGSFAYWIPVYNVMILMDDAVKGAARLAPILTTWGTMAGLIAVLLRSPTSTSGARTCCSGGPEPDLGAPPAARAPGKPTGPRGQSCGSPPVVDWRYGVSTAPSLGSRP
jgi:hypothetical protein